MKRANLNSEAAKGAGPLETLNPATQSSLHYLCFICTKPFTHVN